MDENISTCQRRSMQACGCPYEEPHGFLWGDILDMMDDAVESGGHRGRYPLYIGCFDSLVECRQHLEKHGP